MTRDYPLSPLGYEGELLSLPNDMDFLFAPVLKGMIPFEEIYQNRFSFDHVISANEILYIERYNQSVIQSREEEKAKQKAT